MQQSKLGISITVVGAFVYLMGMLHFFSFFVVIGFVLLYEDNPWLRRCAIKALLISIICLIGRVFFTTGDEIFNIINAMLTWFNASFILYWPFKLNVIFLNAINIIKTITLFLLATKALKNEDQHLPIIDKMMKHYF